MKLIRLFSLAAALTVGLALPAIGQSTAETGPTIGNESFTFRETVRHDNLWNISRALMPAGHSVTQQQIMAALLRSNPDAFLNGNVFQLRRGAVLTVPALADIKAEDPLKAETFYAGQEKVWLGEDTALPSLYALNSGSRSGDAAISESKPKEDAKPAETAPGKPDTTTDAKAPQVSASTPRSGLSDAPAASGQSDFWKGYWPLLAGAMLLALGLWAFMKRGQTAPAASASTASTATRVTVSMEGLEKTRAVEAMAVAQTLVSSPVTQDKAAPVESHETQLKLLMAKAYLELKRDKAAREVLEEVLKEGNPELQEQARKLLLA